MKLNYFIVSSLFILSSGNVIASVPTILVSALDLKATHVEEGSSGSINVDIDNNGIDDVINYIYSSITPPGTCDKEDCMSELDSSPMLTFQIKLNKKDNINVSYMCNSIGIYSTKTKGMYDLFCGSEYKLQWNGNDYIIK
jgi:hypothetical protein